MTTLWSRTLSCGTLSVTPTGGISAIDDLFEIAERRNPKRAFLFVSKVLGRHIPVAPEKMRAVYRQLAEQFPPFSDGPVLFIGMAETAVGLGAGVFDEVRQRVREPVYLTSTRHPQQADLLCEFKENHSHATDHLIYLPDDAQLRQRVLNARTLVMIDDEATTGNTFINLLEALRNDGGLTQIEQVIAVTLTDWSGDALSARCPVPVRSVSLVQGDWHWQQDPDAALPPMPAMVLNDAATVPITGKQRWGRLGMAAPAGDLGRAIQAQPGEKILVLGSSEFVWEPFLLAERLAAQGAEVKYSSTTRSPIATGFAIESAIAFGDNYGLGIANFVYNVAHQQFDRILLCIETPVDSVDPLLTTALAKVAPQVEVISYE
ncbi:phosphoribosyltransferase domain-containing protein [Pantoea sp. PNT02]|uniref:phosphoribosyltransferase domain-containing protein n=1 Tax=unclassified Pantoea TaxID=2630326 RepID=UPI00177F713C|nr:MULTISPECIES: phosphoribosyltransferase domain-containing protein [unclassified Pantoea]MBD9645524.1 phosphoribosyltransferase domain-containing protein [Pantoea sp. PNT02]WGK58244.1 phosphoribosyltransferase domain-containing protein [Pantoea sp. SS70]